MIEDAVRRSQVYCFLAHAFLYPHENWVEDMPAVKVILDELGIDYPGGSPENPQDYDLPALQSYHRHAFGLTGSLFYETEMGLPHEFRQSQELADISGFYHAFGFQTGGEIRERPDFLATELEFMYLLALKEAYAIAEARESNQQVCVDAQRKFLADHLGKWSGIFAESLAQTTAERALPESPKSPYVWLARLAERFVNAELDRLGVTPARLQPHEIKPTPYDPDFSCQACPASELQP